MFNIILTNDDGIHSPGLRAAVQAVLPFGKVTVLAPSTQQTGMARSFAGDFDSPLIPIEYEIDGQRVDAFHCGGSPAAVVHHGLRVLFSERLPDLLISGINYGENVGSNVTVSGTVGAAFEGAAHGIPSIAASLETPHGEYYHYSEQSWDAAAHFVAHFGKSVLHAELPFDVDVLKIDVPDTATPDTAWQITRVSRRPYYMSSLPEPSLESTLNDATLVINPSRSSAEPDSDIYAVTVDRVVSVTPLSLDCTSRTDFAALRTMLERETGV
jgi:5'-nucleotidase